MLEKYFSPGPELLFWVIEQEHTKDNTSHIVSIQTALGCGLMGSSAALVTVPARVIKQNSLWAHRIFTLFLKHLVLSLSPNIEGFFLQD